MGARPGFHDGVPEEGNHVVVRHRGAVTQREDVVETNPGEVAQLRRLEVGAGAFDTQDARGAPAVVDLVALDGGVAAAPDNEVGVGADLP